MVDAIANLALETLHDLLVEETKLLLSASGDVEKVKTELETIRAILMRADRERNDSCALKVYVRKLKDLADEAEILLETYAVKVESNKEGKTSLKEKWQGYICGHNIGKQAQDILSRLADLANKLELEFGQQQSSSHSSNKDLLRYEYAHTVEPHFVGMEKDIKDLVSMVKDETTSRRVIKIYGMGGLGKTTLARKIYNHADLKSYDARAWVCITQQLQAKAVLGMILKQLGGNAEIDKVEVPELVERIHSFLQRQRKCLIVVDDIWENDHWDIIKPAFPIGEKNCKVLLTSRSETIANRECHAYKLECLTENEGWDLLQKIAFQDFALVETDLRSLQGIGRQIVLNCGCLPLAISVIGGILSQKEHTLAEWRKVNEKMDSILSHGGEGVGENRRVKEVLGLSYNALPYYLKPCFLYLACFPEDTEIETERLYLLWMAEGFISHQDNETLRDVAERYLSELAMRCMVQVRKAKFYSPHKTFDSCRLHDLMHDLCSSKAENEDLRLKRIEISRYQNGITSSSGNSIRRLAIINDVYSGTPRLDGLEKLMGLRSFMLRGKIQLEDSTINFERLQSLRILVLDNCYFEGDKLPSKVSKVIHLRYLSLMSSRVRELPQFVCGIPYLQTLDLRVCSHVIRLPNDIRKMKRLKHMYLKDNIEVIGGEKLRLDGLEALETLKEIDSKTACIEDIPKLISLRELHVTIDDMDSLSTLVGTCPSCEIYLMVCSCDLGSKIGRDVFKNVLMSPSLVTLSIWNCDVGGGFPHYEQGMCQNLARVHIDDCEVGEDVMEELANYPMLQSLRVDQGRVELGKIGTLTCRSNSFPQLKCLGLFHCSSLHEWLVEERAMPKLTELWISDCSSLKKVPDGLRFISTLQELRIARMPEEFNERVRGQDYATVSHIPSLHIYWPPPVAWIKANTDGAALGAPGQLFAGGVFWNSCDWVACCFHESAGFGFAFEAELWAVIRAMEIVHLRGWQNVWLESDFTYIMRLCTSRSHAVPWRFKGRWKRAVTRMDHINFRVSYFLRGKYGGRCDGKPGHAGWFLEWSL